MRSTDLRVYFVMGSTNVTGLSPLEVLESALQGGISCFQLREKGAGALIGAEKLAFAKSCQQLCQAYRVPFIVNDDVQLAVQLNADGVHIGQEDDDVVEVRKLMGEKRWVGVSVHSPSEAATAVVAGADYVGVGPVFPTRTKTDTRPVSGTARIKEIASIFPNLPIVGIGGITANNAGHVMKSGACGVAVISAITSAADAEQAARELVSQTVMSGDEQ